MTAALGLGAGAAQAANYHAATQLFRDAAQSGDFFKNSYAYAIYPTVGEAFGEITGPQGPGTDADGRRLRSTRR